MINPTVGIIFAAVITSIIIYVKYFMNKKDTSMVEAINASISEYKYQPGVGFGFTDPNCKDKTDMFWWSRDNLNNAEKMADLKLDHCRKITNIVDACKCIAKEKTYQYCGVDGQDRCGFNHKTTSESQEIGVTASKSQEIGFTGTCEDRSNMDWWSKSEWYNDLEMTYLGLDQCKYYTDKEAQCKCIAKNWHGWEHTKLKGIHLNNFRIKKTFEYCGVDSKDRCGIKRISSFAFKDTECIQAEFDDTNNKLEWVYANADHLKKNHYACYFPDSRMDFRCACVAASYGCGRRHNGQGVLDTCDKYRVCGSFSTDYCAMIENTVGYEYAKGETIADLGKSIGGFFVDWSKKHDCAMNGGKACN